jgi:pimeloyl-ACP methyl ester carboxylesterase
MRFIVPYFVGHSFGGMLTQAMAIKNDSRSLTFDLLDMGGGDQKKNVIISKRGDMKIVKFDATEKYENLTATEFHAVPSVVAYQRN